MVENRVLNKKINLQAARQRLLDLVLVLLTVRMIIYSSFASQYFLSVRGFMSVFSLVSVVGIIATGMTLIIIARGIDLSVGFIAVLIGCVATILIVNPKVSWLLAILAILIIGFPVGGFNRLLITEFSAAPFITTLGSMNIIRGIASIITDGQAIYVLDPVISFMGTGKLSSLIPVPAIIIFCLYILFWLITKLTVLGRNVFVARGNSIANRLVGIRVRHLVMALYALTGILSAVAELVMIGLTSATVPSADDGHNLDIITAVYLGGNSASGSEGSVWETFTGVLAIGILNNRMALLGVQFYWQTFAKGCLLTITAVFGMLRRRG